MALTQEDRIAGGRASAVARRKQALEHADHVELVETVINGLERHELGPKFLQLAERMAQAAGTAEITPATALEIKQLMEAAAIAHKMGRLELGESTSNSATFDVTDRDAQVQALKQRIGELDAEA